MFKLLIMNGLICLVFQQSNQKEELLSIGKLLLLILCSSLPVGLNAQQTFQFNDQIIQPGSKTHLKIPITDQDLKTFIPITIFHGIENGPVLGMTAGVHGYEYPPILAGQQLIQRVDPRKLKGTIILVHLANVEGFLGRSPYVNPLDDKNLNRSFPGDPQGTITEKIANYLSTEVISRCDYFLDMHGGDAPEDLMPYVAYYQHDQFPKISAQGQAMAMHMGFDHIVVFKTTTKDYMKKDSPSTYCSAQAFKIGIPSVDLECGRLGQAENKLVQKIVTAVESLLKQLQMISGQAIAPSTVALIEDRSYLSSTTSGFFYPFKQSGDYVVKGMKLGYITNFFNETVEEVYADQDGVLLLILGTPPVNANETVAVIGKIKKDGK